MVRPPDGVYRYGRAFLVDLVAPLHDEALLQQVIKAACRAIEGEGVDALLCHHISPELDTGASRRRIPPAAAGALSARGYRGAVRGPARHRASRRWVARHPRRFRHRPPVVKGVSRWAAATACGAVAVTAADAFLLERSKGSSAAPASSATTPCRAWRDRRFPGRLAARRRGVHRSRHGARVAWPSGRRA